MTTPDLLFANNRAQRQRRANVFRWLVTGVTWSGVLVLLVMLGHILKEGLAWVDWQFLTSFPSVDPEKAGIKAALAGTTWVISLTACISIPIGVASAAYLEEYAQPTRLNRWVEVNISNLAGVPSIVYGMLGATIFVRWLHMGQSVLAGALTLSLLVLPVIIIASREAIRAVPSSLRQSAFALGATRWQTVSGHVLPAATPGILTGVILALSRSIGETAPLVMMGALTYVAFTPEGPTDEFTALPILIYNWSDRPQAAFHELAAGGIVVLLFALLVMNGIAVFIRHRFQNNHSW